MREAPPDIQRLWRLLDIARTLFSEPDPNTVYQRLLEAARELTGARYAAIGVLNEQRDGLESFHTAGIDVATREAIAAPPRGRGVLGMLVSKPGPLRISDIQSHPASYGFPPGHPAMTNFLGVPIHLRGEVWGNLYLTDKPGEFTESDEEVALIVADWAATRIDLARPERPSGRRWRDREFTHPVEALATADRKTVLLVEDEPVLRTLVVAMLEEQGYLVLAAANGLAAIERVERHVGALDLLITDVVMPRLSGPELAARLRQRQPDIEVLYTSGYNDSQLISRGVEQAKANLLAKPFTPDELFDRVRALTADRQP
jgi:CheY-like chemotaxis protein